MTIATPDALTETITVGRLVSPSELAHYLGVPLNTVYRWTSMRDGSGPAFSRVGKHVRFDMRDVGDWLGGRRVLQRSAR